MDTEIGGDLLDRHTGFAVASDADHVVTELLGGKAWAQGHPSSLPTTGKPTQMSPIHAADPDSYAIASVPRLEFVD